MIYDYLIVGAGLFGSVFAYEAKRGKKCLVIDRRDHIGVMLIQGRLRESMYINMDLIFSHLKGRNMEIYQ